MTLRKGSYSMQDDIADMPEHWGQVCLTPDLISEVRGHSTWGRLNQSSAVTLSSSIAMEVKLEFQ